jgi:hypothetical protein
MNAPTKPYRPIAICISLVAIFLSSCAVDDFIENRRQQALRSELQALGEKCVRINADYSGTKKCVVLAGYVLEGSPFEPPPQLEERERNSVVQRCLGKSCGWLLISFHLSSRTVTKWEVKIVGPPEARMM